MCCAIKGLINFYLLKESSKYFGQQMEIKFVKNQQRFSLKSCFHLTAAGSSGNTKSTKSHDLSSKAAPKPWVSRPGHAWGGTWKPHLGPVTRRRLQDRGPASRPGLAGPVVHRILMCQDEGSSHLYSQRSDRHTPQVEGRLHGPRVVSPAAAGKATGASRPQL